MSVQSQALAGAQPAAPSRPDLLWPYYSRIVAVCMVVLIHTVGGSVTGTAIGSHMWWGAVLLDSAASWAVPVFVMMSGALLLAPGRWAGAAAFYRRRLVKIGVPALVWIVIYIVFQRWYVDPPIGLRSQLRATLFGIPAMHLFYLFVILALYAITPLLRIIVENLTHRQLAGLASAWLAVSWFSDYIDHVYGISARPNALTYFIPYVGYFLAGYVLRDVVIRGLRVWLLVAVVAAATVGQAVEAYYLRLLTPLYKFSALTIAMSIPAFLVLLQVGRVAAERGYTGRVARVLAGATFGVYLVHPIVTMVFTDSVGIGLHPATVGSLAVALAATIVSSWAVVLLLQRIPLLKRIV